jgi:hypothetical protein
MTAILAAIAREFYAYAKQQPGEALVLVGLRPDGTWTMIPMQNHAERQRSRFILMWDEGRAAVRALGESGHKWLIRAHAGPGHISPSRGDVEGLGDAEGVEEMEGYMAACDMTPPVVDMVLSQTTGRWGCYLIRKPERWSGKPKDGYRVVDPMRLWRMR